MEYNFGFLPAGFFLFPSKLEFLTYRRIFVLSIADIFFINTFLNGKIIPKSVKSCNNEGKIVIMRIVFKACQSLLFVHIYIKFGTHRNTKFYSLKSSKKIY